MKLSVFLLSLVLLPALAGAGQIYRHTDARGNVTYTDQPPYDGAEAVDLKPLTIVPGAKKPAAKAQAAVKQPFAGYKALQIIGVTDGATMRDPEGGLSITAMPSPELQEGDRIVIRHNGEEVGANGSFQLEQLDRGTHTFSAEIVNAQGNVLMRAEDVTINVFRTTVRNQAKPQPPKKSP